jgi:CTP-dependent riboflavin kinase
MDLQLKKKKELSTMFSQKVHGVVEYIKYYNDFCFDILDVLESPENVLNHFGIYLELTDEEIQMIQKELMKLAEMFQSQEMIKIYGNETDLQLLRWLE